ncbi:hypothetical protein [Sporosarcina limicola]|uniref:Dynamin family protein n=1 Tax=Sporosarcina limicola TaxID=34101 RepID=A0A927MR72_9BACL|nr:hypothetical protein [Sporosarcina limicola]MBE1555999.1 hypothetical protein [Sporosarcina limicola]
MGKTNILPQTIYPKVIGKVEKLLITLESESTDSEIIEHQKQAKNKLNSLHQNLQETLQSLEKNAEWDVFTIAFYGETNAGKSTLIETLRILLNEKTKLQERANYVVALDEYRQKELKIADLQNKLDELEIFNENKIQTYENIIQDILSRKNVLETSLEKKKSSVNKLNYEILQKVIYSLGGFLKSIVHQLDEQKELNMIELLIFELEQQAVQLEKAILKNQENMEGIESEYKNDKKYLESKIPPLNEQLAKLDTKLIENSDGNIVGDGRSDYTRNVGEYRFNVDSLQFCILDLPGIEGKEGVVQKEIDAAVEKAHVVFYVSGKATPPQKGNDESLGTIEKIGEQLKKQSEVYFVYNKRVKNPRQLLKALISVDESESLDIVDQKMQDTLGEQYTKHISLSAYPAFISVGNYWGSSFEKSKMKFIDAFDSSEILLEKSKVTAFSKWMTSQLVSNVKDKIVKSNFRKIALSLSETRENIKEVSESINHLEKRLKRTLKDSSYQLDETGEIFHQNLLNSINKSINSFKSRLREKVYSDIDDKIKTEEFTEKLKVGTEEETKKLVESFHKEVNKINKEFQTDISEIVKKYERYVDELVESYSDTVDFNFEFNPEINIKSNVNKVGAVTSIIGDIIGVVFLAINITNPLGWVVLAISILGGMVSVGKKVIAYFDSDYHKSQQRKSADENIEKFASGLREELEKQMENIINSVKEGVSNIKNEIEKSVSQVVVMAEVFKEVEDELKLIAIDVEREGELMYGND